MSVKKRVNALEYFKSSVGCFVRGGAIDVGYFGVRQLGANLPANVKYAAYSGVAEKYFVCAEGSVYLSTDAKSYTELCGCGLSPFMLEDINGAARMVLISGKDYVLYDGSEYKVGKLPVNLSCGVMRCGRLFGGDGLTLRWSGAGGFDDWEEGLRGSGRLTLDPARGAVLDLLEYGGKLIAVREYGLTVLSMFGSPENFSVEITDTDCDKIYKNTARKACGGLYFYSASGLKRFDGAAISAVEVRNSYGVTDPTDAAVYCGKYFLACNNSYLARRVILCVELTGAESCIVDEPAEALYIKDGVYVCNEGGLKKLDTGGGFSFESSEIDFGTGRLKTVTEIELSGTADIRITSGKLTRLFYGASGIIRPHMRGKSFCFEVKGKSAVKEISVTAEVINAV